MASPSEVIGVVGPGRMGRGLALAFAYAGHSVYLIDLKSRQPAARWAVAGEAKHEMLSDLELLAHVDALSASDVVPTLERVRFASHTESQKALAACSTIFEAVPEILDAKRDCFAVIGEHAPASALVASTTSTMTADLLASLLVHPHRFINAHWLNPAYLMPLVEISPAAATSLDTVSKLRELLSSIGKVPVVCKSSPGFIVPRIQALAMNEAARMVEEGVATAEEIDRAVRVGFGLRFGILGLLEFIDWGGSDILHHASRFLAENIDSHRFAAAAIVERNTLASRRGLRDGVGFYDYGAVDIGRYRVERLTQFVALLRHHGLMPRRA